MVTSHSPTFHHSHRDFLRLRRLTTADSWLAIPLSERPNDKS